MTACPSDEQLRALVDKPLDTADDTSIAAHARGCTRCRARRDDLARTGEQATCSLTVDVGPPVASADQPTDATGPVSRRPAHQATTLLPAELATIDQADDGEGRSPDAPAAPRPRVFGDYEVLRELARGGMGVVFQARHVRLNRLVALKMILAGQLADEAAVRRFHLEAEAAAHLEHPGIVPIYEVGQHAGQHYFSMAFVEGQSLSGLLAGGPLPPRRAAELMAEVAAAIEYAHRRGVIHHDLKPGNILLDQAGHPRVTDFGLAKKLQGDSELTGSGQIIGTPSYMPPEQADGDLGEVGPPADIYSLGATLYALLTGRPPFQAATPIETVLQVISEDPVPPRRLNASIPRDLETICLKCLHKEWQKRYGSAQELADDLVRYREGSPIRARVTPMWERGLKWSKRRPVAAMALALGVVAFIGLAAGAIVYQRSIRLRADRRNARVLEEQNRGMERLDLADRAVSAADLQEAQVDLATFRQEIRAEPRLRRMSSRIEEKQKTVDDRLRDLRTSEAALQRDRAERDRFQRFRELRQEAQLYAAGFGVLVASDRSEKLRDSAHAALSIYAQDPRAPDLAWTLAEPLPSTPTKFEKARVADDCYDLLLIRSQAADPDDGLRILNRAARLRPKTTAAYHRRRAECLGRKGDLAGRDRENREADRIPPVTALDFFLNGRELVERRRFADAVRPLNSALQADPDQTSAHFLLAVCDFNMKALSPARTSLTTCIKGHPQLVGLYLLRALVSGEEGNQSLEKLTQGHPDEAEAARLRQDAAESIAAAEDDYRTALVLNPNDDLRYVLLTNRGIMWLRSNRLDEAGVDLEAAIKLEPGLYLAHATMAQLESRRERPDAAAASFARAIDCHPEPIVAAGLYRSRALLRAYRSDITPDQRIASLRDFEQAIRLEPDAARKVRDHLDRARLFFAGGQSPEAIAACDAALGLIPDDVPAHRMRISALMELKRYEEVLTSADAYIARGEPSPDIFEIRGLAREARRDYAAASDDFHKALEQTPDSATVRRTRLLNLRGWAHHFADASRLALADFEESLRLGPGQSDALAGRALARIRLGDWRPAVTDAEAAVRLATAAPPHTVEGRQARAQALFNAARVYALAVEFAVQDVSRQGERAVSLYRKYRGRALELLDEALKYAPDREYRDAILNDPALRPLRRGTGPRTGGKYVSQAVRHDPVRIGSATNGVRLKPDLRDLPC